MGDHPFQSANGWRPLCRLDEIEIGRAKYIEPDGEGAVTAPLAVVRTDAMTATVLDDTCPHAGASLSGGRVYDGCLVCPWHAWEFRLSDGRCPDNEQITVRRYDSRVREDGVVEYRPSTVGA
ncbi:MAG: Rieske (2Fe-2S) protein [Phycisphaerales bacterium]